MGSVTDDLLASLARGGSGGGLSLTDQLLADLDEIEAAKKKRDPWWKEAAGGFGSSAMGLVHTWGRAVNDVREAVTPDWLENTQLGRSVDKNWDEQLGNYEMLRDSWAPEDQRPFLERARDRPGTTLVRTAAEAIPSLIPVVAATAVGGPAGGVAVGSTLGFSSAGYQAFDEAIRQGNDPGTARAIGASVGALSALLEGVGARGVAKPLQTAFGRELTEKVLRGETDTLIRQILSGAGKEGMTEAYQEMVQAAGELLAGKPLREVVDTLDDRVAQSFTGGALASGVTGAGAFARHSQRSRRANRNAQMELLELARQLEPEALEQFLMPRQAGEWAMEALPTGDWTLEALQDARNHLSELVVPDVLTTNRMGEPILRRGVRRSASWLGAERPVIELSRQGFGNKVGDELQDLMSYSRKSTTVGRTVLDAEIRNSQNKVIAPAYKRLLALVTPVQQHTLPDPSNGKWLVEYAGKPTGRKGRGPKDIPGYVKKSAGLRYFEEARWTLRMRDLRDHKAALGDRVLELEGELSKAQLVLRPDDPIIDSIRDELGKVTEEHDAIQLQPKILKDSEERLAWLEQHPQWNLLKKAAEAASRWDQHMITMMADAEIITREQEQRILARGDHYAGFYLANPASQAPLVRERLTHGAEEPGRVKVGLTKGAPSMLPSEASLYRAAAIQQDVYRQVPKNQLLKLVEAAPDFWAEAGISLEPIEGLHSKDLRVRAMRDGQEVPVYMPKELLLAFEQLTPNEGNMLQKGVESFFSALSNVRRATALLTPTFALGQTFRDQPEAMLFARKIGYRPYVEMARGMLHMVAQTPEARAFRNFGGGMGSIASLDVESSPDMLHDVALRANEEDIASSAKHAAAAMLRLGHTWKNEVVNADFEHRFSGLFHPMARLLETLDTSTRLGAYLRAVDKGMTEAEALAMSRRAAIDFALQGENTRWGSKFIPFMGARAQSFALNREAVLDAGRTEKAALAEAKAEGKGVTISHAMALGAGAATLLPVFSLVVLPELIHWATHADDDDYRRRDEWERQRYYFWYQFDSGEYAKSPRPQGPLAAIFGYGLGQALDEAYRDDPRTLENTLAILQDNIPGAAEMPVGFGVHQNLVIDSDMADFGVRLSNTPPGVEPLLLAAQGRTPWTQRLIVPDWQQRTPARQQGFRTTPKLYTEIAKVIPGTAEEKIWAATHPGEQISRVANVVSAGAVGSSERFLTTEDSNPKTTSPLWIEQWGRMATGSVGSEAVRIADAAGKGVAGEDVPLSEIPVIRNFVARAQDAPQMWPVRRVLEIVQEKQSRKDLERQPGEGLSGAERKSYIQLRSLVESGQPLLPFQEQRYRALERKSLTLGPGEIASMDSYERIESAAQDIRELLTDWHEYRRAGDEQAMATVDSMIIKAAEEALALYDEGSGENEIGGAGQGWAARYFRRLFQ